MSLSPSQSSAISSPSVVSLVTRNGRCDTTRATSKSAKGSRTQPGLGAGRRDVSVSLERLGGFLAHRGQPGDAEEALRHFTRCLEIREGLLKRNPDSAQAASDVSLSVKDLGDFLAQRGQLGDAEQGLRHYARSLEISEGLLKRNPDSAQAAHGVSVSLEMFGDLLAQRGQPGDAEEALRHFTRCLEIRDGLLKRNPDSAQAARGVSFSLDRLGNFLAQRGQPGDAEEAVRHYARCLEISEGLLKHDPDSARAAHDVFVSLDKVGDFLAQRGQPGDAEPALRHFTRGLEISDGLLKRNPDSAHAARGVSSSLEKLGNFLAQRGQPGDVAQALRHFTRCLEISDGLLKRNPDSAEAARDVSVSLGRLGDLLAHRGQPGDAEKALRHFTRDLEISEGLLKRNPDSGEAARDVSVSLNRLGDFLTRRGQPGDAEEALRHYTRCLEIREGLLKRNPDSAKTARDVMVSLERLGDFLAQSSHAADAEQALERYTRGLEIGEGLLRRNPGSAEAAHDVVLSLGRLGELEVKLQRFESAIAHFEAGIAVLDGMIAKRLNGTTTIQEKELLESHLKFCQLAPLATGNWSALIEVDPKQLPALLSYRATELAKQARLADVAQAAAKLRELEPRTSVNLYNAACAYGLSAALAVKGKPAPTPAAEPGRQKFVELRSRA